MVKRVDLLKHEICFEAHRQAPRNRSFPLPYLTKCFYRDREVSYFCMIGRNDRFTVDFSIYNSFCFGLSLALELKEEKNE